MKRLIASATASMMIVLGLVVATGSARATVPGPSPNGRIMFAKGFSEDSARIFTANPDGTHRRLLLPAGYGCPSWSPDGSMALVCTFSANGLARPATVNADGSGLNLLDNPDPDLNLFCTSWSPDGTRFACEGGSDLSPDRNGLYTVRSSDGGDLTLVTKTPGVFFCCPVRNQDGVPSYSPDGSQITFTRGNQRGQFAIFIVNTDGTDVRQVTPWGLEGGGGNWSPDGQRIVFVSKDRLYLVHPDGSGRHKIAIDTSGYAVREPTWSPDGTRILFGMWLRSSGYQFNLFTMDPDGSHLTQVTDTPASETNPSWGTHPLET